MTASVIIPVWNGRAVLEACLEAVLGQRTPNGSMPEVIAVDNASADGSADFIAAHYPQVRLIHNAYNQGFAGGCNRGLEQATGDLLILLNQDTRVQPGWLPELAAAAADPSAGVVGSKILYPDGKTIQHAGAWIEWPVGLAHHYGYGEPDQGQWDEPRPVEYVTGAAMAFRRSVLEQVGALDEGFWPGYFEDADFCLRIRSAGLNAIYAPRAVVLHHESTSVANEAARSYYYHCGRLRLTLKQLPPQRWVREFAPAESAYLPACVRGQNSFALQLAYSAIRMAAPQILVEQWQADPMTVEHVLRHFDDFYRQALHEEDAMHREQVASGGHGWPSPADKTAPDPPHPPRIERDPVRLEHALDGTVHWCVSPHLVQCGGAMGRSLVADATGYHQPAVRSGIGSLAATDGPTDRAQCKAGRRDRAIARTGQPIDRQTMTQASTDSNQTASASEVNPQAAPPIDVDIFEIHDSAIDPAQIMAEIRARIEQRRAKLGYERRVFPSFGAAAYAGGTQGYCLR